MQIEITKTDCREFLALVDWAMAFIRRYGRTTRELDKARRLARVKGRIVSKNRIADGKEDG